MKTCKIPRKIWDEKFDEKTNYFSVYAKSEVKHYEHRKKQSKWKL